MLYLNTKEKRYYCCFKDINNTIDIPINDKIIHSPINVDKEMFDDLDKSLKKYDIKISTLYKLSDSISFEPSIKLLDEFRFTQDNILNQKNSDIDAALKYLNTYKDKKNLSHEKFNAVNNFIKGIEGEWLDFKGTPTKENYLLLQAKFNKEASNVNKTLSEHRNFVKIILANIGIALTGIGAIFLIGKAINSCIEPDKSPIFFGKTDGKKRLDSMSGCLKNSGNYIDEQNSDCPSDEGKTDENTPLRP
ncbi:MAG: hypothetical protein LEGION0398_MBIBDBAK_01458 [Legionellaceae bacterium]